MKILQCTLVALTLFLGSCQSAQKGGIGSIRQDRTETVLREDGSTVTTTTTTSVEIKQPDSPKNGGILDYRLSPDGSVSIKATTGDGQNIAEDLANAGLLEKPMWAGVALTVAGMLLVAFGPNKKWGLAIAISGGIMIGGTYLLAKYAKYFFLLAIIVVGYGAYLLWDYLRQKRAVEEQVVTTQKAMEKGIIPAEEFKNFAMKDTNHSLTTQKIIRQLKEKHE